MFGRKKKKQGTDMTYYYLDALKNKQIPILVLDQKWHELFPDHRKTDEIRKLEQKLLDLIKQQGQSTNDLKEYEKAKKVIMDNIVNNMTDGYEPEAEMKLKKQEANQKMIDELNQKTFEAEDLQHRLPAEIQTANKELLIACMDVCYKELTENTIIIEELDAWINAAREELKNRILAKQDREMRNTELYKYMHNLLGAKVVEIFDKNNHVWKGNVEENISK
jgi:hypothetical protein